MTVASYAELLATTTFPGKSAYDVNDLEKLVLLSDCQQVWRLAGFSPAAWDLADAGPLDHIVDFAVIGVLAGLTNLPSSTFDVGSGSLAAGKRVLSAVAGGLLGIFVLVENASNWDLTRAPDLAADGQVGDAEVIVRYSALGTALYLQVGTTLSGLSYTRVMGSSPIATSLVAFSPGTRNVVIYMVPSPTGVGRFVLTRCVVRLSVALSGTGSVSFSVGSTSGGLQIIKATTITSATALGVIGGEATSTLGTDMTTLNAYEAVYNYGQSIYANVTVTGTVTGGQVAIYLYGLFLS